MLLLVSKKKGGLDSIETEEGEGGVLSFFYTCFSNAYI